MHFSRRIAATFLMLTAAIAASATPASALVAQPESGSYIVTLRADIGDVATVARSLASSYGGRVGFIYTHALRGFSVRMGAGAARVLASDPRVVGIEADQIMHAVTAQSSPAWGLDRIDQRALPLNQSYTYNATGSGVRAYIIDTGILRTHTEFGTRASIGTDKVGDGRNGVDCNGHGTHVAGTIGGTTYGVAKAVSLIAVRVLGCDGSGATSGVIAGVDWVTANKIRPAVANMSLGGGASSSLDTAVSNSIASGVTYAIAAGNGNVLGFSEDACSTSPARVGSAITVSATDSGDTKASWANYGTCVDIFGPGVDVKSAWYSSTTATNTISGTSMATPHVAGVAAQYLQTNTAASPATVAAALVGNSTAGVVKSPGSGSPNKLLYMGFIGGGGGGNVAPTAAFTATCTGLTCGFTDASSDSDGTIASRSWNFGDGGTSTAQSPSHTYASAGTYTVTLTVTDNAGATGTTSKSVTVSSTSSDPDPSTPTLSSGVAMSTTNGSSGSWKYFKIQVPSGRSSLSVNLDGGQASCGLLGCNPDLDLFVRRAAKPTTSTFNCSAETGNASEACSVNNPAADWWYIGVYVYSSSSTITYRVTATY
jgi:subtilisin family serine protease